MLGVPIRITNVYLLQQTIIIIIIIIIIITITTWRYSPT
jgi:hypothetical protein